MFLHTLLASVIALLSVIPLVSSALTASSTVLVFARDADSAVNAISGLKAYGIPYQLVLVPQEGTTLPVLNSTAQDGNYGGIIVLSEVSYGYSTGWQSALSADQWQALYNYQTSFGVRMVRLDVYPSSDFGVQTTISGQGCCASGVEQLVSFTNTTAFPTANLKTGAGMTTQGLWHYPATIIDSSIATEIAQFAPSGDWTAPSTAAIINTFGTRQQLVWFISWGTAWAPTSNFLMHAHIHWMTRGLFVGRRRIYFSTQVDDLQLATFLYQPSGGRFRARVSDLEAHVSWTASLNNRLPAGSSYTMELGHNGNGNIEWAVNNDTQGLCNPPSMIDYDYPPDTPLEYQKPLGTGTNVWPTTPSSYAWTKNCTQVDELSKWFQTASNRDSFMHVSHTFTHLGLNNATSSDTVKEIQFNLAWLQQTGLSEGKFSSKGLIPPAITGLHNGDAIQAWMQNGIQYAMGDNSRSPLLNTQNEYWPLISNVANNGYAGLTIVPRWSTPIYYNCDLADCTLQEWINTSGGWGDFQSLLDFSRSTYTRHLLALRHDPFMFHQANLRSGDTATFTIGTQTGTFSLLQIWTETILQELMRLTTWPIITLKQQDLGVEFENRMALDACAPTLKYIISESPKAITGVSVSATNKNCGVPIPVTLPVGATASGSCATTERREQLGSDPLTIFVPLCGSDRTYTLASAISL